VSTFSPSSSLFNRRDFRSLQSQPNASSSSQSLLFSDLFLVHAINPNGKKFERVSRIHAKSQNQEIELILDVNTNIFPIQNNSSFSLALSESLWLPQGSGSTRNWKLERGQSGIADDYEYVCYGRVYKFDEPPISKNTKSDRSGKIVSCYISFGGLLMCLSGSWRHLNQINIGEMVYLLIRR
jgi:DNA-directed RNA polymerases I, II, and III subunit RPABC3